MTLPAPLSRGMAAFGAGVGPCGHDPDDDLEGATEQTPVGALYFDPFNRVYVQNDDYSMVEGAGPIQRAAHLMLPLGSIPATPDSGFDVDYVKRAPVAGRIAAIRDALTRAWKSLIETQQIRFDNIVLVDNDGRPWDESMGPWPGRFEVQVIDLITKKDATLEGNVT